MDDELLLRAFMGRTTSTESARVRAWTAAAPANARRFARLEQILAAVSDWYGATPGGGPPPVEALIRQAQSRESRT